MQTYTCATCGKSFERFPSEAKKNKSGQVYCSRKCAAQRQTRDLPDLVCQQCGKTFYRKPSERKLNNNYCSRTCANQAQSRTVQQLPELRKTPGGIEVTCQNCGQTFHVKPNRLAKAKYCSRACGFAARFGKPVSEYTKPDKSGNKNPNFKGTNNVVTARLNAIKFFGEKCMICGWNEVVDVHHIIPRRHGGTNNLDNLIVLCPNHHRLADFGRIDTETLARITHAAIAALSDRLPRFDPLLSDELETVQPVLLSAEPECSNQSD